MGLDSYLYAEKYIRDWTDEGKTLSDKLFEATGRRITSIRTEVGYLRKANAIHKWFVDKIQESVDDCREYYVSREQLEELLTLLNTVLIDPVKFGPELLPTQGGFFFGDYSYGDRYIQDLEETKNILEKVLNDRSLDNWDFYYQSSW